MSDSKSNISITTNNQPMSHKLRRKRKARHSKQVGDGKCWNILSQPKPAPLVRANVDRVYEVIQTQDAGLLVTTSTTVPVFASFGFSASSFDQLTSFQNLFDQYKIVDIEFWLQPENSTAPAIGEFATVLDYDDTANLSTYAQATDYPSCVESSILVGQYRHFRPHIAVAAYSGAFTSFANQIAPWIDMASPSVVHYGVKLAAQATPTAAVKIHGVIRFRVLFRNLR